MPKSSCSVARAMARTSSRSTGSSSLTSRLPCQPMNLYQPSPNGARNPSESFAAATVSRSAGRRASRTSARTIERITARPGNGMPTAPRTVDRAPSVPTTYRARRLAPSAVVTVTPSASWTRPLTCRSCRKTTPASSARRRSSRSTSYWGAISTYRNRDGRPARSMVSRWKSRRLVTGCPRVSSSSASPRASRTSRLRACTANARVRLLSPAGRLSSTMTHAPPVARSPASSRPVGPAPTITTSVSMVSSCELSQRVFANAC